MNLKNLYIFDERPSLKAMTAPVGRKWFSLF